MNISEIVDQMIRSVELAGRISVLRSLLLYKFHVLDEESETHLEAATLTTTDRYLQRLLTADSLAAVFKDDAEPRRSRARGSHRTSWMSAHEEPVHSSVRVFEPPPPRTIAELFQAQGHAVGFEAGLVKGRSKGRALGRAEGRSDTVRALLIHKFQTLDVEHEIRLERARRWEIHIYLQRLMTARSPAEVFEDRPSRKAPPHSRRSRRVRRPTASNRHTRRRAGRRRGSGPVLTHRV